MAEPAAKSALFRGTRERERDVLSGQDWLACVEDRENLLVNVILLHHRAQSQRPLTDIVKQLRTERKKLLDEAHDELAAAGSGGELERI